MTSEQIPPFSSPSNRTKQVEREEPGQMISPPHTFKDQTGIEEDLSSKVPKVKLTSQEKVTFSATWEKAGLKGILQFIFEVFKTKLGIWNTESLSGLLNYYSLNPEENGPKVEKELERQAVTIEQQIVRIVSSRNRQKLERIRSVEQELRELRTALSQTTNPAKLTDIFGQIDQKEIERRKLYRSDIQAYHKEYLKLEQEVQKENELIIPQLAQLARLRAFQAAYADYKAGQKADPFDNQYIKNYVNKHRDQLSTQLASRLSISIDEARPFFERDLFII